MRTGTSFGWGLNPEVNLWGWRAIRTVVVPVLPASRQQCKSALAIICMCRYANHVDLDYDFRQLAYTATDAP